MKEYKVYLIEGTALTFVTDIDADINALSNEKFKYAAEKYGSCYSLQEFQKLFNTGEIIIDSAIDYIRFI